MVETFVFTAMILCLLLSFWWSWMFQKNSVTTTGTIVSMHKKKNKLLCAVYEYKDTTGTVRRGKWCCTKPVMQVGDQRPVRYLKKRPGMSLAQATFELTKAVPVLFAVVFALIVGAWALQSII